MDLFLQGVMDHMECVIGDHRGLVNDDGIVLPDGVIDHVLDYVSLEVRVEFLNNSTIKNRALSSHS